MDSVLTQQAFRFALAPTAEQEEFLSSCAGASRFWFNQGLSLVKARADERAAGADVKVPWSYKDLCTAFKGDAVKDELAPWRKEVVTGSYQAGLFALGNALQAYSRAKATGRKVGFPRYRAKGRCQESIIFQRPRIEDGRHVMLDRRLGPIRSRESMRKLTRLLARDEHARILKSTVQRVNGGWVISFTVDRSAKVRPVRRPDVVIGVDVGLKHLAVLSTGEVVANGRPLQGELVKLRRLQRQLDRQRRGCNPGNFHSDGRAKRGQEWHHGQRMLRTEERIQRAHARVANLRREQAHQLTTFLTREFGVIGVESLAVHNMIKNKRLARAIADVGWGMILAQLKYKTDWAGSRLVAADRFYPSSKTCSGCGTVKAKLPLTERTYTCENTACVLVIDRDHNAALNLAQHAQSVLAGEGLECTVAGTETETQNARGGHISPGPKPGQRPVKREDPSGSPQRGNTLAAAA